MKLFDDLGNYAGDFTPADGDGCGLVALPLLVIGFLFFGLVELANKATARDAVNLHLVREKKVTEHVTVWKEIVALWPVVAIPAFVALVFWLLTTIGLLLIK